jgi:mono/diheme cytochrome c family protein
VTRPAFLVLSLALTGCEPAAESAEPPFAPPPHSVSLESQRPQALLTGTIERGRQRYEIFCKPCHGKDGGGDGTVVHAGFPAPPSFHEPDIVLDPEAVVEVITRGKGTMMPMAERISPADRLAIARYVQTLRSESPDRVGAGENLQ